jgi:hypothetical protein
MIFSEPSEMSAEYLKGNFLEDLVLNGKVQKDAVIVRRAVKADGESHPDDRLQVVFIDHRGTYAGRECRFKLTLPFSLIIEDFL